MTFGGGAEQGIYKHIGSLDQKAVDDVVKGALDAGVNFIDTADVYSIGQSEARVGQALRNLGVKRNDAVIATKFFGEMGPGPNDRGGSRGHIFDSVDASLKRLQTDHIDLYQIPLHRCGYADRGDAARARRSRAHGEGALHRRLQPGRLAHRQVLGDQRARRLRALRNHPGLLFHRRARSRT